jgi:predicted Ser/Thr protein kinase
VLASGTRLGAYVIHACIGEGGMGEVYRTHDTRLDRTVALKVLPDSLANDPERRARFEREAKSLAALNHPHIAQVYGIDYIDGVHILVMEFVDGEDLETRLRRGALPFDEAHAIALQIAEALESAHERGVVHRDLKPANIALTTDGQVKILDFGLAKLRPGAESGGSDPGRSPTITSPAVTHAGAILGTAAYMSPEQAKGRVVDKRSDVWAFGCVLYEMLAGRRAFPGEDVSDSLARVLRDEPDWNALPSDVPDPIRLLLRACLEKDRKLRAADIAVATFELRQTRSTQREIAAARFNSGRSWAQRFRGVLPWAIAAMALLVAALSGWRNEPATRVNPPVRFHIDTGALRLPDTAAAALSPDGSVVVFAALVGNGSSTQLYMRRLDSLDFLPLRGTEGATAPFFSPDSQWVGFFADGGLKKAALSGGVVTTLVEDARRARGATWGDGFIVFTSAEGGLARVAETGGQPVVLTTLAEGEQSHQWPQLIDRGRVVVFAASRGRQGEERLATAIVAQRLSDGERRDLVAGARIGRVLDDRHLVYLFETTVFGIAFDSAQLTPLGEPVPLIEDVYTSLVGATQLEVATNGVILVGQGSTRTHRLSVIERGRRAALLSLEPSQYFDPRVSPDGREIAVTIGGDLWTYDWERDVPSRLTDDALNNWDPVWSPDGAGIIFRKAGGRSPGTYWRRADAASDATSLIADTAMTVQSWHPNGRVLAANLEIGGLNDIVTIPIEGDSSSRWRVGKPSPFVTTRFHEAEPAFSPDGKWVAYQSNETGRFEIYVRAFPGPSGRWQVSTSGGLTPTWLREGRQLLYRTLDQRLLVATYAAETGRFTVTATADWSTDTLADTGTGQRNYDAHPDGKRVMALLGSGRPGGSSQRLLVILRFDEELRRAIVNPK